jgi:hypothetical protein
MDRYDHFKRGPIERGKRSNCRREASSGGKILKMAEQVKGNRIYRNQNGDFGKISANFPEKIGKILTFFAGGIQ